MKRKLSRPQLLGFAQTLPGTTTRTSVLRQTAAFTRRVRRWSHLAPTTDVIASVGSQSAAPWRPARVSYRTAASVYQYKNQAAAATAAAAAAAAASAAASDATAAASDATAAATVTATAAAVLLMPLPLPLLPLLPPPLLLLPLSPHALRCRCSFLSEPVAKRRRWSTFISSTFGIRLLTHSCPALRAAPITGR